MGTTSAVITPKPPFDFEMTAGYLNYYQGRDVRDSVEKSVFRRLLDLDGRLVLASAWDEGTVEAPRLIVELEGEGLDPDLTAKAAAQVAWLLGAGQDLTPFYRLAQRDPVMGALTRRFYGLHLPHTASVFEALVLGIVGQQIATNVARNIRVSILETYGSRLDRILEEGRGEVHLAFPAPRVLAAASVEELRGHKLSWRKAEYVKGVAAAFESGALERESLEGLADEEVVSRLVQLRGIGRWTAQWLLIRGLGRPDALPLGDLALRRAVSRLYFDGEPVDDRQVEEFCRAWSPWRSYATVYWFTALRRGVV